MNKRALIGLLATTSIVAPVSAQVQPPPTDTAAPAKQGDQSLQEITVTASRRSESIVDVPYNISAISGEALARDNVTDLSSLTKRIPGIAFIDRGARDSSVSNDIIIRGLGTDGAGAIGPARSSSDTVSVYLGESPLYTNLAIKDIAQVEVLRGPQGTLYGSGSLGGTIRFLYNKPDPSAFSGNLNATGAATEKGAPSATSDGVVNIPLSEKAALRIVGSVDHEGGFVDQTSLFARSSATGPATLANPSDVLNSAPITETKKDTNYANTYYTRASLLLLPSDGVDIQFNYQYQHNDIGGAPGVNPGYNGNNWYTGSQRVLEPLTSDTHLGDLDASVDFGFATLTSTSTLYQSGTLATRDNTSLAETSAYGAFYLGNPRFIDEAREKSTERGVVQEVRLTSDGNTPLQYVTGLFYQNIRRQLVLNDVMPGYTEWRVADGINPFTGGPLPAGFNLPGDTDFLTDEIQHFEEEALFGEATYHITDQWQVTGGTRVFWQQFHDEASFDLPQTEFLYGTDAGSAHGDASTAVHDHIFKADTSYALMDDLKAYATFSQGFRRGGANALPTIGPFAERASLDAYKPDKVDNYEIGLKGGIGRWLTFSTAAYHIDWDNIQINTASVAASQPFVANGGKATSQGVEFEGTARVTPELSASLGYAYADAKLAESFTINSLDVNSGNQAGAIAASGEKGERTPGSPRNSLTAGADYRQDLTADESIVYHVDGNYRSSVLRALQSSTSPAYYVSGYALMNASIAYETATWRMGLYANNIFNDRGVNAVAGLTPDVISRDRTFYISRPLTIGARLSYFW